MRRPASVAIAVLTALTMCITARAADENLLGDYGGLLWENARLRYNEEHGALYFSDISGEAWVEFPTENASGMWFYSDCGGYSGKGGGSVSVLLISSENDVIGEYVKPFSSDGYFYRLQLGSESSYLAIPDNAERIRVTISSDGEESAYFCNLSLVLSSTAAVTDDAQWSSSGKLSLVQVKTTASHYWFWVALVAVVPIIMFGLKKLKERAGKIK